MKQAVLVASLLVVAPWAARAQSPAPHPPSDAEMLLGAYNSFGVLQYCQAQGMASPEAVGNMRKILATLSPTPPQGAAEMEALGKKGMTTLEPGGQAQVALADAAKKENLSVKQYCGKMDDEMRDTKASK